MSERQIPIKESFKRTTGTIHGFVIGGNAHPTAFKVRYRKKGTSAWITEESHSAPHEWDIETPLSPGDEILLTIRVSRNALSPLQTALVNHMIKDDHSEENYSYSEDFQDGESAIRFVVHVTLTD